MDALDSGVGAVLSQQNDGKLHPYAIFYHRLSPAKWNYDIGDWELLAIKLALEEWKHWLEGTVQPFIVFSQKLKKVFNNLQTWDLQCETSLDNTL